MNAIEELVAAYRAACSERDALKAEVESLRAFKATWGSVNSDMHAEIRQLVQGRADAEAEVERLREALTPSHKTKSDYHGEFTFRVCMGHDADGEDIMANMSVPWTAIKEIMAAIRERAAQGGEEAPRG